MEPPPSTLQAGQRLGPYEILAPIGAGGMGEVYRARDPRLGREVAVKVLPGEIASDPERLRRFEQEARAAGSINHPNILTVYDVGSDRCGPYIVFELLEGSTLRAVLAGGALPLERAADVAAQVARGLAAAHAKGIVHRDLKPENLFVSPDGLVKILDFGLAKLVAHEALLAEDPNLPTLTHATEAGAMLGTVGYMSPEQVRGQRVDARSDVFSFGAILYEMLAGRRAFAGGSAADALSAILKDEPAALAGPGSEVPPALDELVRRCLAKDPAARPQSAQELATCLRSMTEAATPAASSPARASAARRVMLVVLPFENLSRDPEQEYFSDGLTEETIADLGGLGSDQLGVIARTSAMRFKGTRKSVAEIARELGVEFALEGSVRRQDERVRISVRLVRAADQTNVWAQQYDRELRDFLAVQDELGRAIAEKVQVRLASAADAPPRERRVLDQTAYDLYLRGLSHLWRVTRPELERAIDCFREAAEADPRLAVAYAGLAQAHAILPIAGGARPGDAFPAGERAATRALEIDPGCAEALAAMTILRHWHHWDWAGAEAYARRAIARNPSSARAHQVFGRLLTNVGRHDEAIAEIDLARQLDPLAPLILALSADFRFEAHREDEAEAYVRRAHEIDPNFWVAHVSSARLHMHRGRYRAALAAAEAAQRSSGGHTEPLALAACCLGALDRPDEARAILAELERRRAAGYVPASHLATVQVGLGDAGEALRWLERAFEERDVWLTELAVEPRWDSLRSQPRFQGLIRRVGLPPAREIPADP
ncbi:MAG TPA: protein kinase [Thermoanaerobaculaceae bacterium]|nr:protein kinase [Thermoanaerobaculaceae bacterium]